MAQSSRLIYYFLILIGVSCSKPEVQVLKIDISESSVKQLDSLKALSLDKPAILEATKKYVKCKVGPNQLKSKIRFKGDDIHHIENKGEESYRVKVLDGNYNEMTKFSLHLPERRNNVYEYLWQSILKHEGLMFTSYDFVELHLNNENRGIYAIEEGHDSSYSNRFNRPEGVILKFNEKGYWNDLIKDERKSLDDYLTNTSIEKSNDLFNDKKLDALFKSFLSDSLSVDSLFDAELTGKYLALTDVFNCSHSLVWINMRFFYNAQTQRCEFVGYDAETYGPIKELMIDKSGVLDGKSKDYMLYLFFKSKSIQKAYFKWLKVYSSPEKMSEWLREIDPLVEEKRKIVEIRIPGLYYDWEKFKTNQEFIQKWLADSSYLP